MTTIRDIDDPRLTAYALGELDESDRAEVEAFLERSAEARAAVEEIRAVAGVLSQELSEEETPGLTPEHRAAIDSALDAPPPARVLRPWAHVGLAAAAVLVAVVGVQLMTTSDERENVASDGAVAFVAQGEQPSVQDRGTVASMEEVSRDLPVAKQQGQLAGARSSDRREGQLELRESDLENLRALAYVDGPIDTPREAEERVAAEVAQPAAPDETSFRLLAKDDDAGGKPAEANAADLIAGVDAVTTAPGVGDQHRHRSDVAQEHDQRVFGVGGGAGGNFGSRAGEPPEAKKEGEVELTDGVASLGYVSAGGLTKSASAALHADLDAGPVIGDTSGAADEEKRRQELPALGSRSDENMGVGHSFGGRRGKLSKRGQPAADSDATRWAPPPYRPQPSGESYAPIHENPFVPLTGDPLSALSTFSIDVDSASYSNVRRFLNRNQAPPPDAVRIEELINAFAYDDPQPVGPHPFGVNVEVASAPWTPAHRLVRIGLAGRQVVEEERDPVNLVFLVDVSGSMKTADKLPLLVSSLKLLLDELDERDRVAIVTYASDTTLALPSTSCADKATIFAVLDSLSAGGSTHASAGIQLAYQVATGAFLDEGTNRVLLATDGDFNVGVTSHDELQRLIEEKARSGVFLTVLGFGTGNLKDDTAELLANKGNGHYAYLDSLQEAHRVLVREAGATLVTIAKDVKIQVEFNPAKVAAYRLIGYENRALAATDFRDDRKDAGEVGAGHTVTALYEVVPFGVTGVPGTVDLKYQRPPEVETLVESDELLTVNVRYKRPDEDTGRELSLPVTDHGRDFAEAGDDFRFAASVAAFGMLLRHSSYRGTIGFDDVIEIAGSSRGEDPDGDRVEFVRLARVAQGVVR